MFLGTEPILIGRGEDADISVAEPNVSRRHCIIQQDPDGQYVVEDLLSSHGTDVNGRRVRKKRLLDGDTIKVGLGFTLTYYSVP